MANKNTKIRVRRAAAAQDALGSTGDADLQDDTTQTDIDTQDALQAEESGPEGTDDTTDDETGTDDDQESTDDQDDDSDDDDSDDADTTVAPVVQETVVAADDGPTFSDGTLSYANVTAPRGYIMEGAFKGIPAMFEPHPQSNDLLRLKENVYSVGRVGGCKTPTFILRHAKGSSFDKNGQTQIGS